MFEKTLEPKKDCFAYNKHTHRCNALNETYCLHGECNFYKTKENFCNKCKNAKGRNISCEACQKMLGTKL